MNKRLAGIILFGLLIRLLLVAQPMETLLGKLADDDAFYYFELVKNVVEGRGAVFNQGTPTNGFHPLYALLLIPIFKFLLPLGIRAPVYGALVMLSVADAFTSFFLYKSLRLWSGEKEALLAAALWSLNPWVFMTSLIGVETPIQALVLSASIYFFLKNPEPDRNRAAVLGVLMGLLFLSRMDGVFVLAGITLSVFRNKRSSVIPLLASSFITVLPWLLWSYTSVGTIFPVSGSATKLVRLIENDCLFWVAGSIYITLAYITNFFVPIILTIPANLVQIIPVAGIAGLLIWRSREKLRRYSFLLTAAILYYAYYWFYQIGLRRWYSLYTSLLLALLIPQALRVDSRKIAAILALFILNGVFLWNLGNSPAQEVRLHIAEYINSEGLEDVGSFNTGTIQYFTGTDVRNLDGVMNPVSYEMLKEGDMDSLVEGIDYIVESEEDIRRLDLRSVYNLQEVRRFTSPEPVKPYLSFSGDSGGRTFYLLRILSQ